MSARVQPQKKKKKSGLGGFIAVLCGGSKGHEEVVAPNTRINKDQGKSSKVGGASDGTGGQVDQVIPVDVAAPSSPDIVKETSPGNQASANATGPAQVITSEPSVNQSQLPLSPPLPVNSIPPTHNSTNIIPNPSLAETKGVGIVNPTTPVHTTPTQYATSEPPLQDLGMTSLDPSGPHLESEPHDPSRVVPAGMGSEGVHIPIEETEGLTSGAVQPPGSGPHLSVPNPILNNHSHSTSSRDPNAPASSSSGAAQSTGSAMDSTDLSLGDDSFLTDREHEHDESENADDQEMQAQMRAVHQEMDEERRLIAQGGIGIPIGPDGQPAPLLPPMSPEHQGRKCLVLDLDETLLHSSFKMINTADYIVPVEIENQTHNVYVIKRPGVDNFLKRMGEVYEVVVFTASLSKYADPVLDILDIHKVVKHRLFRESCYNHKGNYVKDLSQLGREMSKSIIIDNSPASYIFHPNNAVPVSTWFNDPHDTELTDLCPFLVDLGRVDDIRGVLDGSL